MRLITSDIRPLWVGYSKSLQNKDGKEATTPPKGRKFKIQKKSLRVFLAK